MQERRRSTVRDLRRDNRSVLLWALYFDQPRTRQDLSTATGLSPASVSNVIRGLIDEGIVVEAGSVESEGGRPRVLLRINPEHRHVVGVDVGETRIRVELFDLMMTERAKAEFPLERSGHDARVVADRILAGLDAVLSGVDPGTVLGAGIGVPGVVLRGSDPVVHGPTYGWDAVPLERMLRSGTDLPLYIDNGAKTMGQAELWFGAGRGAQHAVIGLIGSGVGASIITGGVTHRGSTSSAGEWGHTTLVVGGRACRCGSAGCLEAYAGAEAILDRYGLPLPGEDQESQLAALLALAATDARAAEVIDETALFLGAGIAGLVNLLDPERIILGGWAGLLLGERMLPAIRAAVARHSLMHAFGTPPVELCRLGPDAVALGAATLPVERFLNGAAG
ncbi:ROK family transcriptional regulator [Actinomadura parmotrematis]|uniref:ROK family transcriptional regulator n=1 Tax=Actinomadura parmotrematis TaxID=2864039 RepID=A0ABS7G3A1_9ACTN|nr:ROK family transcriptional regulator [Actinomadura parmotrematis]MBW8487188.1 ROK family transcriptional regulator [Actinomadura parmotrematis]